MTGKIEFLVDEKGKRKSVLMSYSTYLEMMQDIEDLRVKIQRSEETPEDFDNVLKELKNAGRL